MLARDYRITQGSRINKVRLEGKCIQSENFRVFFLKREDLGVPKFAFIISRKVSNLSVHRNRVERALSEAVRRLVFKLPKGYDFVFLVKKEIATKTTEEIMHEVEFFFKEKFRNV